MPHQSREYPSVSGSPSNEEPLKIETEANLPNEHYPSFNTRLLCILTLIVQMLSAFTIGYIALALLITGSNLTVKVLLPGSLEAVNLLFTGALCFGPNAALRVLRIASIVVCLTCYTAHASAFVYIGLDMAILPSKIYGFPTNVFYPLAIVSWTTSILLQGVLHGHLYTYAHIVKNLRRPTEDLEKALDEETGKPPKPSMPARLPFSFRETSGISPPPDLTQFIDDQDQKDDKRNSNSRRNRGCQIRNGEFGNYGRSESSSTIGHSPSLSQRSSSTNHSHHSMCSDCGSVPIVYWTPDGLDSESNFNPNMGNLRPTSVACDCATLCDEISERSHNRLSVNAADDATSVCSHNRLSVNADDATSVCSHNRLSTGDATSVCSDIRFSAYEAYDANSIYSYNRLSTDGADDANSIRPESSTLGRISFDYSSNRSSVETFYPAPGQLNMHPTTSYMDWYNQEANNAGEKSLKPIPQNFHKRYGTEGANDEQPLSCGNNDQPVVAQHVPPQSIEENLAAECAERRIATGISEFHMVYNENFKLGGKAAAPGTVVPGPSKPLAAPKPASVSHEDDDGMVPAVLYARSATREAVPQSEIEMLNFTNFE